MRICPRESRGFLGLRPTDTPVALAALTSTGTPDFEIKLVSITAVSTTVDIKKIELELENKQEEDNEEFAASTPAKMLDGRHMHIDVSREFVRVERDVICAQNSTELSKVLQNFCNFCEENPLYLRTRKFVPWRQVQADLCREKIILNDQVLIDHCISTGPGIVLLEKALRKTLKLFLSDINDMDESASTVPTHEKCPSWWSEKELQKVKRVKRKSETLSNSPETTTMTTTMRDSNEHLDDFVRRFTLWTLQAVDRTVAADAFQVLYDCLNPQSPRILLPPSHNVANEPIKIRIDSFGIRVSIYANYDCWIPGACDGPGKRDDVHLTVLTQIDEELHFSDFRKLSSTIAARHEQVNLTKSGSGRVLKMQLRTPDSLQKVSSPKRSKSSYVNQVFMETLSDKAAIVFSDVASNIFHVNMLSDKVRDNMNVGIPLFTRGSRSMRSQSRIRMMPNFLCGASMLELTSKECQSRSKKFLSFTVNVRSIVYILVAHSENTKDVENACPEWLQERFFLRDEHVHLMQPIGSSEGVQIWQSEEQVEEGGKITIPGLAGYGGPMIIAVKNARHNQTRSDDGGYLILGTHHHLLDKRDEEEEEEEEDYIVVNTPMSPGRTLVMKAFGNE